MADWTGPFRVERFEHTPIPGVADKINDLYWKGWEFVASIRGGEYGVFKRIPSRCGWCGRDDGFHRDHCRFKAD